MTADWDGWEVVSDEDLVAECVRRGWRVVHGSPNAAEKYERIAAIVRGFEGKAADQPRTIFSVKLFSVYDAIEGIVREEGPAYGEPCDPDTKTAAEQRVLDALDAVAIDALPIEGGGYSYSPRAMGKVIQTAIELRKAKGRRT